MGRSKANKATVRDFCAAMEAIAPSGLAQEWDNVGLIAGDPAAEVRKVLLCIDLTAAVVDEALRGRFDLVMAYHPPIFTAITSLRADSAGTDSAVFRCIRAGIAIYSTHTALDAADGGTNDALAELCGIEAVEPLEFADDPTQPSQFKMVVFVPQNALEKVSDAVFEAGAGRIGEYSRCCFRVSGQGSFLGGTASNPAVGKRGRIEVVDEVRLETIVPASRLAHVVKAMLTAHPYEEPAFDIYPLKTVPRHGIGRVGMLPSAMTVGALAKRLKKAVQAADVQIAGEKDQLVERVVIVAGSAGTQPFRLSLTDKDVIVTGEIRHHDALAFQRTGCAAIALGHWASERPVLFSLRDTISESLPGVVMEISRMDNDPFRVV